MNQPISFFTHLKSRSFYFNLIGILLFSGASLFILSLWLEHYTGHDISVEVPDMTGKSSALLPGIDLENNLSFVILDSVYDVRNKKGIIIRQDPEPGTKVKKGRMVYLYATAILPPRIKMPKLLDMSLRQAVSVLESYGFRKGTVRFVPDQCANCVLHQKMNSQDVEPGELVFKNSSIDLIVGKGLGEEEVSVPNFIGLNLKDAIDKILESSLGEGEMHFDEKKDSLKAIVYKQLPQYSGTANVRMGSPVELYFTLQKDKIHIVPDSSLTPNEP